MKKLLFIFSLFAIENLFAQPTNDDCTGAITIATTPFGLTCSSPTIATTVNATSSSPVPSCANATIADDDIWYSFTAASQSVIVRISNAVLVPSGTANMALEILSGNCGSFSSIACDNAVAFGSGFKIVSGLTIGNVYYLRFWSTSSTSDANFNFCVQDVPDAPSNDECAGAIGLTINPFGINCTNSVAVNTTGATQSTPAPSCTSTENNDDVWYHFTATSQSVIIRVSNVSLTTSTATTSAAFALYAAVCPTTTSTTACDISFAFGSGFKIVDGLTIGTTYYLRLWTQSANNYGTMNLCIQEVPPPPTNDECTGAIGLTVNPFGINCTSSVAVNTTGATQSTPAPSCTSTENNDDVWYSFTATSQSIIIRVSNVTLTTSTATTSAAFALYAAACPTSTSTVACDISFAFGSGLKIVDGLTIGTTYYLRMWTQSANNYGTMNLCVQEVPPPPSNNECTGAIGLTVNPFGINCTNSVAVNTTGATQSSPAPSCTSTENNDDVWYHFTATSQSVIIRVSNVTLTTSTATTSAAFALYTSACPTSTSTVACDISFAFGSGYKIIDGLTIGTTYYLRMWTQSANNYGTMNLCVQEVPPPPSNNECAGAIGLTVNPFGINCTSSVAVNTTGATQSTPTPSCTSTENNDDVWYHFTATSQSIIIRVSNITLTTSTGSTNAAFSLYASACPTSTITYACENAFAFGGGYKIVDGLSIGTIYYLRIWTQGANNYGAMNLCVQEVPAAPINDNCANAITISTGPPTANCLSPTLVNTTGATQSTPNPSCTSTANNDDVWYSFVATTTIHKLVVTEAITTTSLSTISVGYALYNSCPASTTALACNTAFGFGNGTVNLSGLTVGNTYLLRLWTDGANNYGSFKFCILETPANNECSGAINIPVTNGFCVAPVVGNLSTATTSAGFGTPSCNAIALSTDIWYKTTVPTTGNVIIQTSAVNTTVTDLIMEAYSGSCGALTAIACDDNNNPETSPSANHARITLTGRNPGEIIYCRVMPLNLSNQGDFVICAWDTTTAILPAIAAGGNCVVAPSYDISTASLNRYMWVPLFDDNGKIIAEIYADGINLNTVNNSLFVNTFPVRNNAGKYFLDRNLSIYATALGTIKIRIYYQNSELSALQLVDGTVNSNSLQVINSTDSCQSVFGNAPIALSATGGNYGSNYFVQFSTASYNSFYIQGKCGTTITWNGNSSTAWDDPNNWDCSGVPWINSTAIIPAGRPRYPLITQHAEIKNLIIASGASVNVIPGIFLKLNGQ